MIRHTIRGAVAAIMTVAALACGAQDTREYSAVTDARLESPEARNWLMYLRQYDSWSYSPLRQISTRNVTQLTPVWTMSTGTVEGHQSPPIVNDGIMFVTTPFNQVIAIDAKTGDLLWRYRHTMPADIRMGHPTNRGVALYGDKVYTATSDARVVALDAKTGAVVWNKAVENYNNGYYMTIAPLAARGRIMVGVSGGERGIRGFVVALEPDTGEQVWKTYTVPAPGEPGSDTWPGDSWRTGGAPVWITGSFDPELGLTYWGTGNPGPWTGDARPGDNLYTNSVIALDVETGALKGYHQYHWNDSWDWDEVSAPLLVDLPRNGRLVPGLVHPGRNGYLWMLERSATGISFIAAKPYVKQNVFTSIDPVTGRPEYDMERKPGIDKPAIYCPSLWGGKDWPPAAYNPGTGYLYIPANENLCQHLVGEDVEYRPGQQFTGAQTLDFLVADGADHIGELQAWNLRTGERVWTHEFQSPNWGPVMTTAGGLVFSGGTNDRYFRAFDAATGRLLWQYRTNSGITGVPTSFEIDGVQYIAVQSGWGVDAQAMTARIDTARGTETIVPQGGVVWVFALRR
ncbi:MAG TPA: PQQ-dependent dehydrogenase, methanol/ethanol family [Gammaproteobacteria bacterium]|nr:PQQ-dependent dehydrogenase, methanol/ethanol family [Gammaproteobacteria bacterium]